MASALASAAAFEADEFLDVLEGRQRTFNRAQMGRGGHTVEPRSRTGVRHRVFAVAEIRKEKKRQPNLAIFCPDVSPADPRLGSDDTNARLNDLSNSLDDVLARFPQCRFAALFLPPHVVVTEHFKALLESAKKKGCTTVVLACACPQAGVVRQDVTHSWELVWALSRAGPTRLHQPFAAALVPPPRVPADKRRAFILTRLLRFSAPPAGLFTPTGFWTASFPACWRRCRPAVARPFSRITSLITSGMRCCEPERIRVLIMA